MQRKSVVRFVTKVAETPVSNRNSGARDRAASMFMRALALGFLAALATSVALWLYDRSAQRQAAG